jgi:hypothetical protein
VDHLLDVSRQSVPDVSQLNAQGVNQQSELDVSRLSDYH